MLKNCFGTANGQPSASLPAQREQQFYARLTSVRIGAPHEAKCVFYAQINHYYFTATLHRDQPIILSIKLSRPCETSK
jgi:hypothetical protein